MFAFHRFGGPDNGFGGVGEVAAGEVRRRVDFVPGDVVEDFVVQHLQSISDAVNVVGGARHPDRAVGLQDSAALVKPQEVKRVVADDALRLVPAAFIHAHHTSPDTGDAAIREKIGRIGEDHIHRLIAHPAQQLQRIGLIEPQVAVGTGIVRRSGGTVARASFLNEVRGRIRDSGNLGERAGRQIGSVRSVE